SQVNPVVQPSNQSINALSAKTTTGEKTVVFEEKKNWLGRTKVVPKLVDASAASTTAPMTTGTTVGTASTGAATTTANQVADNGASTSVNPV
ncbi:hypothetical protein CPC16_004553, partial [Podila verticillata]